MATKARKRKNKFYHVTLEQPTGWSKDLPPAERREAMLQAHGGDELAAYHALDGLAKVTKDKKTKRLARVDAEYFRRLHAKLS